MDTTTATTPTLGTSTTRGPGPATALAVVTAVLALVSAVWTFVDPGLLHGPAAMQGSARGTALVLGVLAVPVLLVSVWRARLGSGPALVTWAGALLYVVYNAVLFLFLTPFNAAFLVYVALFGTSLWAVGHLAMSPGLWQVARDAARRAPVRGVAVYVWVVAVLNAIAWLAMIIPSLGDHPAPMLEGTGVQTNAIYVQDLAVWLPLAAVGALWLWRREARGALVVGAVLGLWAIESVSIAVDQWFGVRADPDSPVVSLSVIPPFLVLAVVGLVPLWLLLRSGSRAAPGREVGAP
ncbi:hypothetical protein [Knoellia aerolata]|uniref:Uncharacterized protein n=1 Tax=Knoellia aerolata DSM 18566 TaxID=1385519 RepID=A0A0A0JUF9_9MICO|nr:hypothetical protein [Knoellia aerolata]KGN40349.1 hypothetical protein N801_14750 [Knoellia aerolata DSM 18566]